MSINQKRGPTTGNLGRPEKRQAFIAEKESYAATAREITSAIGQRAARVYTEKNQGQISPNTNKGRGPTRGNK